MEHSLQGRDILFDTLFYFHTITFPHPPDWCCISILNNGAAVEILVLSMLAGGKNKPPIPIITVNQAVIELAKQGGFLARRGDGHPGPTVVWRGFHRLSDAVDLYEIMMSQKCG